MLMTRLRASFYPVIFATRVFCRTMFGAVNAIRIRMARRKFTRRLIMPTRKRMPKEKAYQARAIRRGYSESDMEVESLVNIRIRNGALAC